MRLWNEYGIVRIVLVLAVVISTIILILSGLISVSAPDTQKLTAYECGFDPFGDARSRFDVRFYLVAILFLIFDLEATYLFPWALTLGDLGPVGFWTRIDFLIELTVGFIYAWKIGALEWSLF